MPKLLEYDETLEFRSYHAGTAAEHRILMPSELDRAIKRLTIASQKQELERLEEQGEPAEIRRARASLSRLSDLPEEETAKYKVEIDLAREKIASYESGRVAEQYAWETALWRTVKGLEKMEAPPADGGTPVFVRFRMREFTQGERLDADEEHSELETRAGGNQERQVKVEPRNLALLGSVLLGEWVSLGLDPKDPVPPGNIPMKTFAGIWHRLARPGEVLEGETEPQLAADPADLQQTIAQTLIERMWAKNTMSPELVGFFNPPPSG